MQKLSILGASGHGKVVAEIAVLNGYDVIEFYDDDETIKNCGEYPVVGRCVDALQVNNDVFVAIGDSYARKQWLDRLTEKKIPYLIHPASILSNDVSIGVGTVVMAGVVINAGTQIGKGCIINTSSSVDHDCLLGDFVHIAVGAHLCGTVMIGLNTWIGTGTVVSNNISICDNCVLGAGSVVIKNIVESGTYIGVPVAKMVK